MTERKTTKPDEVNDGVSDFKFQFLANSTRQYCILESPHLTLMTTVQIPHHQSNGCHEEEGKEELDLRANLDLERVTSMLDVFNHKSRGASMNDWMQTMQSFGEEIATLEPKLTFISKSVRNELFQIKEKEEGELHECFERQIVDYRKVRCLEKIEVESLTR